MLTMAKTIMRNQLLRNASSVFIFTLICVFFSVNTLAKPPETISASERAVDADRVLREIMRIPEQRIPDRLLKGAEGIAVIPNVVKLGFVVGGRAGRGLISVRSANGTWSTPAFIKIRGGSLGFQAGVQATDIVLIFRSKRSIQNIVNGKFTLGADAAVAAGPVGRQASAATDLELKAEIYSYSRSRGLFAGVALDGAVLSMDHRANDAAFGKDARAREILENRLRPKFDSVVALRDQLEEYTASQ